MPTVPPHLLDALPASARAAFERVYPDVPGSQEELRARIEAHVALADQATRTDAFVDQHLAHVIADRLGTVLGAWPTLSVGARRVLHAAIAYFALREDAEDDMSSVLGFEDDAQVTNACLRALKRPDLEIDME
jgi:hypothetical protein